MGKFIILLLLVVVSLAFAKLSLSKEKNASGDSQERRSETEDTRVEFRNYNTAVVAKVEMGEGTYDELSNTGFRTLAGYIFGGNEKSEKIAMTSPVMFDMGETKKMYFFMPAEYELSDLPNPSNENVELTEMDSMQVAVITFKGWANEKKINKYKKLLKRKLDSMNIEYSDQFYFLGYNSPFEINNRRNEVAVVLKI